MTLKEVIALGTAITLMTIISYVVGNKLGYQRGCGDKQIATKAQIKWTYVIEYANIEGLYPYRESLQGNATSIEELSTVINVIEREEIKSVRIERINSQ